jgi:hypothetical protein
MEKQLQATLEYSQFSRESQATTTVFVCDFAIHMLTKAQKCRIFSWELPTVANFFLKGLDQLN